MNENTFFVTGGTLPLGASSYVSRQADTDLYEALLQGRYCYLLNTRQMGKSSLVVRTAERLRQEIGASVAIFELSAIGQNVTPEQLYYGLCNLLGQQLRLEDEFDDFWFANESLSPMQRFFESIRRVALPAVPGPLVIVVDEVDVLRSVQQFFSTDEFFGGIRDCHNRRVTQPEFQRLTFCLVGVATPSDLIQDTRVSPFNVGQRIVITDFTEEEAAGLASGLGPDGRDLLSRALFWTGGHPYLTQRLCQELARRNASSINHVDQECERLFLTKTARESDDNLTFVRDRLLRSGEHRVEDILDLYTRVRMGRPVFDDDANPLYSILRLSGIVKVMDNRGRLIVRNRIYERAFDLDFIKENMPGAERRRQEVAARRGRLQVGGIALAVISALLVMLQSTMSANQQAKAEAEKAKENEMRAQWAQQKSEAARQKMEEVNGSLDQARETLKKTNHALALIRQNLTDTEKSAAMRIYLANDRARKRIHEAQEKEGLAFRKKEVAEKVAADKIAQAEKAEARASTAQKAAEGAQKRLETTEAERQQLVAKATEAKAAADSARQDADRAITEKNEATTQLTAAIKQREAIEREKTRLVGEISRLESERLQQAYINSITAALNQLENDSVFSLSNYTSDGTSAVTGNIGRAAELLKRAREYNKNVEFEWRYLNGLCRVQDRLTSLPLSDDTWALALTPNDNSIIAANLKGTLFLARNGQKLSFSGERYRTVALSPQGEYVLGGDNRGNVTFFRTDGRKAPVRFRAGEAGVTALSVNSGPTPRVIAGTSAGKVAIWNASSQKISEIKLDNDVRGPIRTVSVDARGERALVSTARETAIYSLSSGHRLVVLNSAPDLISGAAFFPGGSQVALLTEDNQFLIINASNGSLLARETIDPAVRKPRSIVFSARGMKVAIGGTSSVVATLQLKAPDPIERNGKIIDLAFTPDFRDVIITSDRDSVLFPPSIRSDGYILGHARLSGTCVTTSRDQNLMVVGCRDGAVELFDRRIPGKIFALASAGDSPITRVAISPNSGYIAAGRANGKVTVWELGTQRTVRHFQPNTRPIQLLSFLPDNAHVAFTGPGDAFHLCTTDGESKKTFPLAVENNRAAAFALSSDGKILAAAQGSGQDYTISLYDTETGMRTKSLAGHINIVSCLAFSPTGNRLVSGSYDGNIILWDVASGDQVLTLRGLRYWNDSAHISTINFASDGQALAVGTETGKVIVLRAEE